MSHKDINALCLFATLLCGMAFAATVAAQQRAQVPDSQPIEIYADSIEPPAKDLADRVGQLDAAIVARVNFSEVKEEPNPHPHPGPYGAFPWVTTEMVVTILDVLKANPRLPGVNSTVRISQPLGSVTWNGKTVVRRDGKGHALEPGGEYVLLLRVSPTGQFVLLANDTFRLSSGTVETPSAAKYALGQAGLGRSEFVARVREAARAQRTK